MQIEVTAAPPYGDHDVILGGLLAFNREQAGVTGAPLAVLVRERIGGPSWAG